MISLLKIVRNFIFLLVFLNVVIVTTAFLRRELYLKESVDWRSSLSVYKNYAWAAQYFRDNKRISIGFAPLTGFRTTPLSSETIHVDTDGFRKSRNDAEEAEVLFLGASTVFGAGSDDYHTIPSLFSEQIDDSLTVRNMGVNGSGIFQNYISLTQYFFSNKKPRLVISLDGGIENKLITQNQPYLFTHPGAEVLQAAIDEHSQNAHGNFIFNYFNSLVNPLRRLIVWLKTRYFPVTSTNNEVDYAEKLDYYARFMINSWEQMMRMCNANGVEFYCIYSPILTEFSEDASSKPIREDLQRYSSQQRKTRILLHDRVVALIKTERYRDLAHHFVDLSKFLDSEPDMFIDGVGHFSPEANKRIAAELNLYFKKNTYR